MSSLLESEVGRHPSRGDRPLFGRAVERSTLLELLEDPVTRIVTVTGRGGVGKSSLAVDIAAEIAARGHTTVRFVSLVGVVDADLVLSALAEELAVQVGSDTTAADAVASYLGSHDHLLVLDAFEHVTAAAGDLADVLARCPATRCLVTSQAALRLPGEVVVPLAPLPTPAEGDHDLTALRDQPAVATYCAAARVVDPTFELDERNVVAVAELCRRLGGLPLAIEVAGSRAATAQAADLLHHLDSGGLGVLAGATTAGPRPRQLHQTLEWTFSLLEPRQRDLLARLCLVTGAFSVDLAVAFGEGQQAEVLQDLTALAELHLVDPTGDALGAGFVVPDPMRSFVLEHLSASGLLAQGQRHVIAVAAGRAAFLADELAVSEGERVRLHPGDVDVLLGALKLALEAEYLDEAVDLARGLAACCDTRGYPALPEALVERAVARTALRPGDLARRASLLGWSARVGLRHHRPGSRRDLADRLSEAEALAVASGDDDVTLLVLVSRILVAPSTGDVAGASAAAEQALLVAARPANNRWLGWVQVHAGMLAHVMGDERRAIELGMAALHDARRRGDDRLQVLATMLLGPLSARHPEATVGVPTSEQALALARRAHQRFYESVLLARLVQEAAAGGDGRRALWWAEQGLGAARRTPGSPLVLFHLLAVAAAAGTLGDWAGVARYTGAIGDALPMVLGYLTPRQVDRRQELEDRARAELGADRFSAIALDGGRQSWASAVDDALDYVQRRLAEADGSEPAAGAVAGSGSGAVVGDEATPAEALRVHLTARQREVLVLLSRGLSNKAIARELGVSVRTVMHHTTALYRALGVQNRSEATAWAFRSGLVG